MKIYTSAPLPFQGQKRRHVKEFANIIKALKPGLVIDLFGGSGLLAHTAKRTWPQSRVIYNDYDNYCERLAHVAETNKQLLYARKILQEYPKDSRITGKQREDILKFLEKENKRGYVDWITLSSSLCFAMNYVMSFEELQKDTMYNNVRRDDYTTDGYLDGLEWYARITANSVRSTGTRRGHCLLLTRRTCQQTPARTIQIIIGS